MSTKMITPTQFLLLSALMGKVGLGDAHERRDFAVTTIGREVEWMRDLTEVEASEIIDALQHQGASDPPSVTA